MGAGTGISTRRLHDRGPASSSADRAPARRPSCAAASRTSPRTRRRQPAPLRRRLGRPDHLRPVLAPGPGPECPVRAPTPGTHARRTVAHTDRRCARASRGRRGTPDQAPTDPARSTPEALHVLRPGGALALWWNVTDHTVPWTAGQDSRLRRFFREEAGADGSSARGSPAGHRDLPPGLDLAHRRVPWSRRIPLATHLADLGGHSAFLVLGDELTRRFLAEERDHLAALFPDGTVEEEYVIQLGVAIR
ncbi:SAM-dependent methyltransferase [Streptomyces sp. ITFR-16]|uniref:SAM-dependent methyltransferase n=1 Tax=Streptomyces sp. ITFR-16 TaxID=3075198 RepID=UPI0037D9F550